MQLWDHDATTSDDFLGHADIAIGSMIFKRAPLQGMLTMSHEALKMLAWDVEVHETLHARHNHSSYSNTCFKFKCLRSHHCCYRVQSLVQCPGMVIHGHWACRSASG